MTNTLNKFLANLGLGQNRNNTNFIVQSGARVAQCPKKQNQKSQISNTYVKI